MLQGNRQDRPGIEQERHGTQRAALPRAPFHQPIVLELKGNTRERLIPGLQRRAMKKTKDWTVQLQKRLAIYYVRRNRSTGVRQSRPGRSFLVIKLLQAKTRREDIPTYVLKNGGIHPDKIWRLLGQCQPTALPEHDNLELFVRRPTREPASRPNRKPGRYERLLGDEPVRVYVPLMLRPWVMDRAHKEGWYTSVKK